MPNLSSVCSRLFPSAIWQQWNQSVAIQITLKWDAQCSPKQMVIYMGHWRHSCVQPLHDNPPGPAGLVTHATLAYFAKPPCSGCQHGTWQGYPRRSSCCRGTRVSAQSGLLLLILVGKATAGQAKPTGGTFKTCFLAEGFCLEQACVAMKGKLQIYPEDNVKG